MLTPPYSESGTPSNGNIHVAVIGGGITGVALALGLQARGVSYTLYERNPELKEIGAGVGFSPNAEAALMALDPAIHAAYKRVAMANGEDYFQWVDGFKSGEVIYKLYLGEQGFQGCRRSDFIDELSMLIPKEKVKFGKAAEGVERLNDGRARVRFRDGTDAVADIVIGCDGIHSRIRKVLLGEDNPASYASYSHQFCFRALVPMEEARKTLGDYRTSTRFMYNGPNAHSITYPVSKDLLNVLLVISDPKPWEAEDGKHTSRGLRQEALDAFKGWHPQVQAIIDLLPEEMDKWAIFDMLEHQSLSYSSRSVCIAGDAAHASGPHLGAGSGFGMEDALMLAALLEEAKNTPAAKDGRTKALMCQDLLSVYTKLRLERTQWLIQASRDACDLFQWKAPNVGSNVDQFQKEITWRFHKIWNFDVDEMTEKAVSELRQYGAVRRGGK